jgi:hypothetical protein
MSTALVIRRSAMITRSSIVRSLGMNSGLRFNGWANILRARRDCTRWLGNGKLTLVYPDYS